MTPAEVTRYETHVHDDASALAAEVRRLQATVAEQAERIAHLETEMDHAVRFGDGATFSEPVAVAGDVPTLIDRLRGIYRIPVNDGCGPLADGRTVYERTFETTPIQHEAADALERLAAESEGRRRVLFKKAEELRAEWVRAENAEAERDAQVREAFMAGRNAWLRVEAGRWTFDTDFGADLIDQEAFAAYLATRARVSGDTREEQ